MSLWDIAIENNKNSSKEVANDQPLESSILLLGNKNSGKSSIILRFLDRNETPKPTVALEYTFGRRARGHNIVKDVVHIWELGGGTWLSKLINYAITPDNIMDMSLVIVVDLSEPSALWITIETLLKASKARIKLVVDSLSPEKKEEFRKKKEKRLADHPERDMMEVFPIPLVFIGGKYDLFKELESDKKILICKTLRFLNHYYGGSLHYFSVKEEGLISRTRALLSHHSFGTADMKQLQIDHKKPLAVPLGLDSFEGLRNPPSKEDEYGPISTKNPLELWKSAFTTEIPQNQQLLMPTNLDNPAMDAQFKEPMIDSMRQQKEEELERYRKVAERKMRLEEQEIPTY